MEDAIKKLEDDIKKLEDDIKKLEDDIKKLEKSKKENEQPIKVREEIVSKKKQQLEIIAFLESELLKKERNLRHDFQKKNEIFSRVRQIQDLGQLKYKLRLSSKRTHGISKIISNLGSCEFLARLESKIRKCLFFNGSLL